MARKRKQTGQSTETFEILEGLDGIRHNPTMYLGELGDEMVFRQAKELVDNFYDEFSAGRCKEGELVVFTKENRYIVADMGQGIPIEEKKLEDGSKVSIMTAVFSRVHAGGKFNDKAYKTSAGTHGVGSAAVTACSSTLRVWTKRNKKWYTQSFTAGKPDHPKPKNVKSPPKEIAASLSGKLAKYGTLVEFVPDQSVVSVDARRGTKKKVKDFEVAKLAIKERAGPWLRDMAMLNPGLRIRLTSGTSGKSKLFENTKGLGWLVTNTIEDLELSKVGRKPLVFQDDYLTLAIQWTNHDNDDYFKTYVNTSPTADHGTHVQGFREALFKAIKPYQTKKDKFKQTDLLMGIVGVLNWKMHGAQYSSQVKDKLVSKVNKEVEDRAFACIEQYFKDNKTLPKQLIKRAVAANKGREELSKVMQSMTETRKKGKGAILPGKLSQAPDAKPHERELFIVEGDSAGGTAVDARDPSYQEVLKLSGKPLNAMKAPLSKILSNEATANIMVAIGVDLKSLDPKADNPTFSADNLRVGNVFMLSDADADGSHINMLELGAFYRLVPDLIKQGRVYVVDAPLYNAIIKGKHYGGATFEECYEKCPQGTPKHAIIRAKGWGEVNADVMDAIAFDPEVRNLLQIQWPETKEEEMWFRAIVGEDASERRKLLGLKE